MIEIFNEVWVTATITTIWNRYWGTEKGLFGGIFTHPAYPLWVPPGVISQMTSHYGYRILVIGTKLGSVAVYVIKVGKGDVEVRVCAHPDVIRKSGLNVSKISEADLRWILGYDDAIVSLSTEMNIEE
jgi:hypothetical protein